MLDINGFPGLNQVIHVMVVIISFVEWYALSSSLSVQPSIDMLPTFVNHQIDI